MWSVVTKLLITSAAQSLWRHECFNDIDIYKCFIGCAVYCPDSIYFMVYTKQWQIKTTRIQTSKYTLHNYFICLNYPNSHVWSYGKVMRGDSVGTSIRCPESQEGACESMKGPIALPRKFYFDIFIIAYFQLYLELI
jgi:hypothetical protein